MSSSQSGKRRYNNGAKHILVNEVFPKGDGKVDKTEPIYSLYPRLINANRIIDVEFMPKHFKVRVREDTYKEILSPSVYRTLDCSLIHLAGRSHNDRICVIETPEDIYHLIKEA